MGHLFWKTIEGGRARPNKPRGQNGRGLAAPKLGSMPGPIYFVPYLTLGRTKTDRQTPNHMRLLRVVSCRCHSVLSRPVTPRKKGYPTKQVLRTYAGHRDR